jgi:hypothetical protein
MNKAIENNNKKEAITQSQCHSSSKNLHQKSQETILENSTIINTVADSAATGNFSPNKNNERNNHHNIIEVVCANNQTMESVATTQLHIPELSMKAKTAYRFNFNERLVSSETQRVIQNI